MAIQQPFQLATVAFHHLRTGGDPSGESGAIRIQNRVHPALPRHRYDLGVDFGSYRRRYAARHYQPVVGAQSLPQLAQQLFHVAGVRVRAGIAKDRVDVTGFIQDGYVRPRLPLGVHEVTLDPVLLQRLFDVATQASGRETHRHAFAAQLPYHPRDVDPLAPRIEPAGLDPQSVPSAEAVEDQRLIDCGIQGEGDDHDDSGRISP